MNLKRSLLLALAVLTIAGGSLAQDEHSKHHPPAGSQASTPPSSSAPQGGSGMGQGVTSGGMMEHANPPAEELYPSLMNLPEISPEQRVEIARLADERMQEGTALISQGLEQMTDAAAAKDYAAMQAASEKMREGLTRFNSGVAAQRALREGKAPREIATEWFKREMNLPVQTTAEHRLSPFHYALMIFLLISAAGMVWFQYARLRRADRLLSSLAVGAQNGSVAPAAPRPSPHSHAGTAPAGAAAAVSATTPAGRWSGQLRVIKIFQETPDVRTFRLAHPSGADLPFLFEPGQFLTVSVNPDGKETKRSYSIASSACRRTWCEITVKLAPTGVVSNYLHNRINIGDLISVSGPYGKFTFRGHEADSVVFIGGGVGITPLMSSIRCLTDQAWTGDVFLIYGCNTIQDIIFREEIDYLLRRYPNLHATIILSKESSGEWKGERGRISKELLLRAVPELASRRIHICGPPPMMEAVKGMLAEVGVSSDQIKTENFLGADVRPAPPAAAPIVGKPAATCAFVRSGKSAPLPPDRSILEVSEDIGVNIDYSCREGYCGVCKIKLLSGHVSMRTEEGLTPDDKAANLILACQARSDADVQVDA